jgi:3-methyladenine DNA glycosylase AlkC
MERTKTDIRVLGHAVLQKENYTGHKLLSKQGLLLAKIPEKRFYWYLRKNLATQVDERTIQLNFDAKGDGNNGDAFYMSEQLNQCVCCGDQSHYTRHHVVPHEYRRYFPVTMKASNSHDILLLCSECHEIYETEAMKLKKDICDKYNVTINGEGKERDKEILKGKSCANALLNHRSKLPESRLNELLLQMNTFLKAKNMIPEDTDLTSDVSDQMLKDVIDLDEWIGLDNFVTHGEGVVNTILDGIDRNDPSNEDEILKRLDDFAISWRCHFIDIMKPKFINEHWDPRRTLKRK